MKRLIDDPRYLTRHQLDLIRRFQLTSKATRILYHYVELLEEHAETMSIEIDKLEREIMSLEVDIDR